jgi:hypothetical protein
MALKGEVGVKVSSPNALTMPLELAGPASAMLLKTCNCTPPTPSQRCTIATSNNNDAFMPSTWRAQSTKLV